VSILSLALTFFLVTNPIGNSPTILALVKDYDFQRQKFIIMREGIFALILALFFQFFGEFFLGLLHIKDFALTFCGGILLFLVALKMIFAAKAGSNSEVIKQEPFIVPIATPLLSGPGLLTIIMLYSKQEANDFKISAAILLAWVGVLAVMAIAPYLQKILGKRGLVALEQLMGLVLAMIAMEMVVKGASLFAKTLHGS
jgi:multiple antibiotic resistance protein